VINVSEIEMRRFIGKRRDEGASLIEFAMVAPFLLLLLFGLIEFAWLFSQNLDVRHGAREGARLVAVNYPYGPNPPALTPTAQASAIVAEICDRMEVASGAEITLSSTGGVGEDATAVVEAPASTLTGFLDWAIPASMTLQSDVTIRVEQPATWAATTSEACP
jgi:Flp pilus assembly protein TadG